MIFIGEETLSLTKKLALLLSLRRVGQTLISKCNDIFEKK